jgi:hypothetical protein
MDIVLWNQSPKLEDSDGQLIAEACDLQMQEDVAPAYGWQPSPRVSFRPHTAKLEELPENCLVIIFAEDPPAAAAVAGYQTAGPITRDMTALPTTRWRGDRERNFARVYPGTIRDNEGTISSGARSISAATSHECIEARHDRNLALWVWNENGRKLVAGEVCDQVEDDEPYTKRVRDQDVAVSNFVYPAWFDARAPADSRFDHMGSLNAPFSCSKGGYLIVYDPERPGDGVHTEPPQQDVRGWNDRIKLEGFARTRVRLVW